MNTRFAVAMARRELRSARRRFALYGACMAIGIAAVVALHALRETVRDAVDAQSQSLLGADLRVTTRAPIEGELATALAEFETEVAQAPSARVTRFGSMALAERSGRTRLVDVQATTGGYPFYGAITTNPPGQYEALQSDAPLAVVDPSLLVQLDARVGDPLVLGEARFTIAGSVARAPGSFGLRTQVAPRVFIADRHLAATGLVQLGSLVEYIAYWKAERAPMDAWLEANTPLLESSRANVLTVRRYQREMSDSFASLTRFLGLVGLAALALGTIGVASGVRVFVREKLDAVAVLRSLGATPRDVVATYALLALALGGAAGVVGVAACIPLVWLLPGWMSEVLPVEVGFALSPRAVVAGIALGLGATAVCAIGPLLDLAAVAPLRALRRDFGSDDDAPSSGRWLVIGALVVGTLVAALWQAPTWKMGLGFAGGLAAALALLAGAAIALSSLLRARARQRSFRAPYWLRQGVANLFRPRNHTLPTTVAIGFALFLVATLHAVQTNVLAQIARGSGPDRPNLVLFDVQPDQRAELATFLDERGVETLETAPLVSARLGALNGRASTEWLKEEELHRELRWALRREYRLTYRHDLAESEELLSGEWWGEDVPAREPYPVSLERDLAERLGVSLGDAIRWEVQGVPVESVVTSVREVDWGRMATNFFVVMPPVALEHAPQSGVVVGKLDDANARAELQRDLVVRFPNVSALDASVILRALDATMAQVATAIRWLALFTLATGFAILVAAASAARSERTREALLLRVLGASSSTVFRIQATEAVALAALAAAVGTLASSAASWALVVFAFELPFAPPWADLFALAGGTLVVTALLGTLGAGRARSGSPQAALREAMHTGAGAH